jgi:hypothetical protein
VHSGVTGERGVGVEEHRIGGGGGSCSGARIVDAEGWGLDVG